MNPDKNALEQDYPFEVSRVAIESNNLKEIIREAGYILNEPITEIAADDFFKEFNKENTATADQHEVSALLGKIQSFLGENFISYKIVKSASQVFIVGYINTNYHLVISSRFIKAENI
ncbi:MAG: hypothetical protein EOP53_04835 [Sphingobacteriales bacterium]|nr:MAG: hypothetical protein EOP53_04835 [Sphingobacteriales bacterium]